MTTPRVVRVSGYRAILVLAMCLFLCLLASCASPRLDLQRPCAVDSELVPACGALWGITPPEPTYASLKAVEAAVGRKFDLLYRFHDINDNIPDQEDRKALAAGNILHFAIDSRDYASADPSTITWADIVAGRYDRQLQRQADGIAEIGEPVFVTFDHEPDQEAKAALGTPADFVAAWRHVHDLFEGQGATNVVWVWVVMGYEPTFETALQMWPGNDYVDWISWEAYNASGCRQGQIRPSLKQSFAEAASPFYSWIRSNGGRVGMDVNKPMMISEAGTVPYFGDPESADAWYLSIPSFLESHPQIKAISLWDHTGSSPGCDFRFSNHPAATSAVARAGEMDWVNSLATP